MSDGHGMGAMEAGGVVHRFARQIVDGPPHGTDREDRAWTLLPFVPPPAPDKGVERRRARFLVTAAQRVLIGALYDHGDPQHAAALEEAVERGVLRRSFWGQAPPSRTSSATHAILYLLRVKTQYDRCALGAMISSAFWAEDHLVPRYHGPGVGDADSPRSAASEAANVYASWASYVGDRAYVEARDAMLASADTGPHEQLDRSDK